MCVAFGGVQEHLIMKDHESSSNAADVEIPNPLRMSSAQTSSLQDLPAIYVCCL